MTCVIFDRFERTVYADSYVVDTGVWRKMKGRKKASLGFFCGNPCIYGVAGDIDYLPVFQAHYENVATMSQALTTWPSHIPRDKVEFGILCANADFFYVSDSAWDLDPGPHLILGTGRPYALTAMHLGKRPMEALRAARDLADGTEGPFFTWRLQDKKGFFNGGASIKREFKIEGTNWVEV